MSLNEEDKRWITELLDEKIEKLKESLRYGQLSEEDRKRHQELDRKIDEIVQQSRDLAERTKKMKDRS